jgi:Na+-driven multidrug efflux pump
MGVAGAALATVLSQAVSLCVLFWGIRFSHSVSIRLSAIRGIPALLSEIFHGGLPSLCRQGISAISTACLNIAAKPFGDAAIAAMSVVGRIMWFASATTIGFGQGFQPVCGFNYGAGRTDRVKRAFWFSVRTSTVMLVVLGGLCAILAPQFVGIFRDDPAVIEIGALALRLHCTTLPLFGFICLTNMMLQTCKKTIPASILAAARQGLFFFPTVLILANVWGLFGIQFSQVISDLLAFALTVILYLAVDVTGRKKQENRK